MLDKIFVSILLISLWLSPGVVVAEDLSKRDAEILAKNAHDSESFMKLAIYCGKEADRYEGLASRSQDELTKELVHPTVGSKFPNAADRARRWEEYYRGKAQLMRMRESEYKKKAVLTEQLSRK